LTVYADTSFVISLYVTDRRSAESRERIAASPPIWFTPLHRAESAHAIAQQVFHGKLSDAEAQKLRRHLDRDRAAGLWLEVEMPENVFDICADLARRYGPRLGICTLDSLHVACALQLQAQYFWTFDERQNKLAKAVGLETTT
jgi:predicted nucleic acid-binding protein